MSPANPSAHARRNAASPKGRSTPAWRAISLTIGVLCVFTTSPAHAQVSFDGGGVNGGAVRIGASSTTCDATTEGAIKYVDASNRIELCDDSAWIAVGGGGGGSIDGLSDAVYDTGADHNMRIGSNTSMFAGAAQNLFVGEGAGTAGTSNAADWNVGVGYMALGSLTTGSSNAAVGAWALAGNSTGSGNTAVGESALGYNTWGVSNTAVGGGAMLDNDSGARNVAVGNGAMRDSTADDDTVLVGYAAGVTGAQSKAVGIGTSALSQAVGDNNIAIGYQAGDALTSGASNIIIGYDVDTPSATASSQLSIGNLIFATGGFGTGTTVGLGNVGIKDPSPGTALEVSGGFTITPPATFNLTGDNQLVTVGNNSYIRVSSNNATATNRTFCLSAGQASGQILIIEQAGSGFQAELEDLANPACTGDSPQSLTATMTFNSLDDTISLIWNGTSWLETARANN